MPAASYTSVNFVDSVKSTTGNSGAEPDDNFWAECRRKAMELNIPAWKLAEEYYQHSSLDDLA